MKRSLMTPDVRPRMFLYLGIGLVVLAVVAFPTRIPLQAQPMDVDYYNIGWLFAPIIGIWGLASLVIGLVQSSSSKTKTASYLLPILAIVTGGLAYASYMVVVFGFGVIRSVGRGEPFWWLYFGLVLAPTLLVYSSALKFLKSDYRGDFLAKPKARIAVFTGLAVVPLTYSAVFLLLIYLI